MIPRILYVEDAPCFQRLIKLLLKDIAELSVATTLKEGETLVAEMPFQLILLDFMFPEGDAFPLLFKIRQKYSPLEVPIVMLTSAADRAMTGKFYTVGVNATVRKPPEGDSFRSLIHRMLANPTVEKPESVTGDAHVITWQTPLQSFAYCPNICRQTQAPTAKEAMDQLQEELRVYLLTHEYVPSITSPKTLTYFPKPLVPIGRETPTEGPVGHRPPVS